VCQALTNGYHSVRETDVSTANTVDNMEGVPKTAGDRIAEAARKRRWSLAEVSRRSGVPANWVRSLASNHIHKADPRRLRALADVLDLDYRELLALTDQLGEVEAVTRLPERPSDVTLLLEAIRAQTEATRLLTASVAQLAAAVGTSHGVSHAAADGMTSTVLGAIENVRDILLSREPVPAGTPRQDMG
jgi:transcriptional regulator with XRE-family HTH domain